MSVLSDQSDFSSSARLWDKHEEDSERAAKLFASDDSSESLLLGTHVEQQSYPRPVAVSEREGVVMVRVVRVRVARVRIVTVRIVMVIWHVVSVFSGVFIR